MAEWGEVKHIKKDGLTPLCGLIFLIMGQKSAELVGTVPEDADSGPAQSSRDLTCLLGTERRLG